MEFDDILKDKEPEAPKEVVKEEVAPDTAPQQEAAPVEKVTSRRKQHLAKEYEAQGRDPSTGQFIPKEAEAPKEEAKPEAKEEKAAEPVKEAPKEVQSPPKQDFTERELAFLKRAEEERHKRQALEKQLAEKAKEPEKAFWDDPEGRIKKFEEEIRQRELGMKLNTAEMIARSRYKDFDENVAIFRDMVIKNPGLVPDWVNSPDPAEYAYSHGKTKKELDAAGGMDKLIEKKVAEAKAEAEARKDAEWKAKLDAVEKAKASLPGSLSDVRGGTVQKRPVFTGPTPFDQILKGN